MLPSYPVTAVQGNAGNVDATEQKARVAKIEDVAKEAGVSIMSVSRVMRGVEGVSAAKRTEIRRIARKLGYSPSRVAGSLAAANSTLIGISIPTLFEAVFAEILDGMRSIFNKAGFQTIVETTDYIESYEEKWVERMISWHPAGVILSGVYHSQTTMERLRNAGIPTLEIWDYTETPIDMCIGVNHLSAGYDMGLHLVRLGYRKPAYVGVSLNRDPRAEDRFNGLSQAFAEVGSSIKPISRLAATASFEGGFIGTAEILDNAAEQPDVICFLNDHMAFGGIMECERRDLHVPEDIGIVGFNGLNINVVLPKQITTSVTPRTQMGATGARMLVSKISGAKTEQSVLMPVEIFAGDTTRPLGPG